MRSNIVETWIGVLVLAVAGAFLFYGYSTADMGGPRDGYPLSGKFGRVDGISVGTDVRLAGVKIGAVSEVALDSETYQADLTLSIREDVEIPEDSVAKVSLDGLLGGAHISIEPGGSDLYLQPGDEFFITQGSVDFIGLATRAFLSSGGGAGDADTEE